MRQAFFLIIFLSTFCGPNTVLDAGHPEEEQLDKSFCPQYWLAISAMEKDKAEKGNKEVSE